MNGDREDAARHQDATEAMIRMREPRAPRHAASPGWRTGPHPHPDPIAERLFDRDCFLPGDRVLIEAYVIAGESDDPRDVHLRLIGAFGPVHTDVTVYPNAILGRAVGDHTAFVILPPSGAV